MPAVSAACARAASCSSAQWKLVIGCKEGDGLTHFFIARTQRATNFSRLEISLTNSFIGSLLMAGLAAIILIHAQQLALDR